MSKRTESPDHIGRREVLRSALHLTGTFALANLATYVIGSAFKDLDGSLVAGAKTWQVSGTEGVVCPGTAWGMPRKIAGTPCPSLGDTAYGSPMCGPSVQELTCLP